MLSSVFMMRIGQGFVICWFMQPDSLSRFFVLTFSAFYSIWAGQVSLDVYIIHLKNRVKSKEFGNMLNRSEFNILCGIFIPSQKIIRNPKISL